MCCRQLVTKKHKQNLTYVDYTLGVQHGGDVPSKRCQSCANEHGLPGVIDSDVEVQRSQVFVLPIAVGTATCLTYVPIVNVWEYFQAALVLAEAYT